MRDSSTLRTGRLRVIAAVFAIALTAAGCAADGGEGGGTDYAGFIVIDSGGSQLCDALAESYPPQCGGVIVELADLRPDSVVALQSPDDPAIAASSWTDYVAGVGGDEADGVLTNVVLTDPIARSESDGLVVRIADLGLTAAEPFTLPIDARNITDDDATLTFTSGQRVEFTLSDDSGEVYRWSEGMMFTQAIETAELPAGSVYGTTLTGEPIGVAPGTYLAKAWITATEAANVVVEWETTVE